MSPCRLVPEGGQKKFRSSRLPPVSLGLLSRDPAQFWYSTYCTILAWLVLLGLHEEGIAWWLVLLL